MPDAKLTYEVSRRSARLVTWARAWRAGIVSYDDVADAAQAGEEHMVADAPLTWTDVPLREAIGALSRLHPNEIRLVLPAPGDPRGLPGPGPFTGAALHAGEAVIAGSLGLVPEVRNHTSGSGDTFDTVLWRCHNLPTPAPPLGEPSAAEAESDLSSCLLEATNALTRLEAAAWRPELGAALLALRRPDSSTDLPPGYSPRARRLFARATVLDRVLALAGEITSITDFDAQQRQAALRPLTTACRRALVAACNSPLEL